MIYLQNYINGKWIDAENKESREIFNPATGEVIAHAADGNVEDAQAAIEAARQAFDSGIWSKLAATERAAYLYKIADKLEESAEEISRLETLDNGKPLRETQFDVADAVDCFRYYAGMVSKPDGVTYQVSDPMQALVVREPVGVCGLIVPWNYPLLMAVWKIAPALAAGNTIVFKPSEVTPVTAKWLFKIIEQVGVPAGVANMVMGPGKTVGNQIAESHDVDKVSFTGGTATGRSIMKAAAGNIKKISLELGGKSPNIIFADADFEAATDYALFGIYAGAGQVCSAGSRLLVEDSIYDRFVEELVERAKKIKVGPGNDPETEMGPLVSREHMEKVLSYIAIGKEEGAKLLCGGRQLKENGLEKGCFVEPTIFGNTRPDMKIVREEIFGPVLVIQRFKGEADAVRLANDTDYGLAAGVFTNDGAKAMRVIKKIRAGITWINCYHPTYNEAPWGGYKQSGIGRGLGTYGYEEFTEVKQININLEVEPTGWFSN
ncbi:aldehyde dehydrogenase family protein [Bacillus norwichensis]|uniref:Aldehyde dehydrogenase family protein n=1 Tax=Bacillus norwichensis TaxID=2762217 RepID=A0ABR8VNE6_9BACI|nr:aldehyde dehydrogenase family protein [Bacillus norwichensis]MBD8006285.1 aldehyde dehydrogenase family protein [Bacillus norwichensis]